MTSWRSPALDGRLGGNWVGGSSYNPALSSLKMWGRMQRSQEAEGGELLPSAQRGGVSLRAAFTAWVQIQPLMNEPGFQLLRLSFPIDKNRDCKI